MMLKEFVLNRVVALSLFALFFRGATIFGILEPLLSIQQVNRFNRKPEIKRQNDS
jgi:hypothetical protein